jgi:hypothetical protein
MRRWNNLWKSFINEQCLHESASRETIEKIEKEIMRVGGTPYIVGGAVRDELIPGAPASKDIDFLVTGLPIETIVAALRPLGKVDTVGKSFGVIIAKIDGEDFDIAIPRVGEKKVGEKHTDFEVQTDYRAPVEADLGRRDFTINAMAKDSSGNIIDKFGGQEDIQNRTIRAVGNPLERFEEDSLRMLRAVQFAVRFDFDIEEETANAIKKLKNKLVNVSSERILEEFKKAWSKGTSNSDRFIEILHKLEIGDLLFGENFRPIGVKIMGSKEDQILGNFISFFLAGGDFEKMRPTNEMKESLLFARYLLRNDVIGWGSMERDKNKIPLIIEVFRQIGKKASDQNFIEVANEIEEALQLPLTVKSLSVGGGDIARLGFKGKQIGEIQKAVLAAIHRQEIQNDREEILDYIGNLYAH